LKKRRIDHDANGRYFRVEESLALKANLKDIVTEIAATMAFLQRRIMTK
jgi:hypothetical protein